MINTLFVFGTRPEAIKLCPVILQLRKDPDLFHVTVCVTAQHRAMLDQVLRTFAIVPEFDLDLMLPGQTLGQATSRILGGLEAVMVEVAPDLVIVQGDTTSTLCGALSAFYHHIPVAHVEAGLRTRDLRQPFPEELNRVLTGRIATLHFAATAGSAANLTAELVDPHTIAVTGNSGIDAVLQVRARLNSGELSAPPHPWRNLSKRLILVTAHRRESFGSDFESICRGLVRLAARGDVQIVYPVHRNPNVTGPAYRVLDGVRDIVLIEPLDYVSFVALMMDSYLIITDSGGIQEEGPSLGKPILVMRDKTERPEAVEAGTVRLVGPDENRIFDSASELIDSPETYQRMARVHNPYGDGDASRRISNAICSFLNCN